jgi:uncharacterized membrane protein
VESFIDPADTWFMWAAVLAIAAFGVWSDTRWLGRWLSGAVIALLGGILLSNIGIIPIASDVYDQIYRYVLPLAIPLVLFEADLARIVREARRLMIGFLAGAAGTIAGGMLAFLLINLGEHGAEMTAALTAAYVGGTANLLAVGQAVGLEPGDSLAAVVAAGNLTVILYLVMLFLVRNIAWLARWLDRKTVAVVEAPIQRVRTPLDATHVIYSLTISVFICAISFALQDRLAWPGMALLSITLLSVFAATAFPRFFARLDCASPLGFALLHILFAAIGASASIQAVIMFGPVLMLFASVMLATHLLFIFVAARLFALDLDEALVASNACALGAPTAAAMALSFRRNDLAVPAMLCGVLGYAAGNFVGLAMYHVTRGTVGL